MNSGIDLEMSFTQGVQNLGLSHELAHLLWIPLPMLLVLVSAVIGVLVTVWLERKISAAAQQRIGPEYAGALGILQPMADGLKLLVKEDIIPARADSVLFTVGPILVLVPVILSWLIVPFGQNLLISNVGIGIFLWIALSSIQPIGLLMSGYSSNNKYSLLGGLRAAAQSISYEIPLALAVLAIVMMSNSLSTVDIVEQQNTAGFLSWNIWRQPVGFIIFWICALAECERLPFDLPEAEEELVAGYQTEYAGMKFALFYLAGYINLVLSALLVSVLYLGGWGIPLSIDWFSSLIGLSICYLILKFLLSKDPKPADLILISCFSSAPGLLVFFALVSSNIVFQFLLIMIPGIYALIAFASGLKQVYLLRNIEVVLLLVTLIFSGAILGPM